MKNIFKEIIGRILFVWMALLFTITSLLVIIYLIIFAYPFKDPKRVKRFVWVSKIWQTIFLYGSGCPFKIKGQKNFQKDKTYVVIFNHNSFFDVFSAYPFIPGGNKTIAKDTFAKIPLFGLIYKAGSVLINRKSEKSRAESFRKMKEVLDMGLNMCLYPEGTRNKTNKPLQPFQNGAFKLAIETKRNIIPAIIFGTRNILPYNKSFYFEPHKIEIHFLAPVEVNENTTMQALKESCFNIMENYFVNRKDIR